jgi:hypothetical protein
MEVTVIQEVFGFFLIAALSITVTGLVMGALFMVEDMLIKIKDKK